MPSFHILRETPVVDSFRVQQVRGMFELDMKSVRHEWTGTLPTDERPWSIGCIVGASGSGKTTIAREIFPEMKFHEGFKWPHDKPLIEGFPEDIPAKEICAAFNAVGFSSPPSWLKPFSVLSNGQKFRAELARSIITYQKGVIFDEFTSVVDRTVAQIGSSAVSKAIRKGNHPPFVAVSCHYDIIDWLDPDWVFDVSTMAFEWRERRRFPEIQITIHKSDRSAWPYFSEHHYLSHDFHKSAQVWIACIDNRPVALGAALHFPHPSIRNFKKEHRVVVLPDFQGVGIGNRLSEWMAERYLSEGMRYISISSNPAMIHYRNKSPKWILTHFGRCNRNGTTRLGNGKGTATSFRRITASFEYQGEPKKIDRVKRSG
jgi:GNAT superfamily N-acetyltransferase